MDSALVNFEKIEPEPQVNDSLLNGVHLLVNKFLHFEKNADF